MTNKDIMDIAMAQSAMELCCRPEDLQSHENKVVLSSYSLKARAYLSLPTPCWLVSYGSNIVASVSPELETAVRTYINAFPVEYCFEPPNMYVLHDALGKRALGVSWVSEYFLPDLNVLAALPCAYEMRILTPIDFPSLYHSHWYSALSDKRPQLDVLAAAAYDGGRLVGLAGCSADCDTMWQIGVDVLPEYRCQGIASALTSRLALEILARGKVPFYCAAWSNLSSVRNAIRSGFRPAWVELQADSASKITEMNVNGQTFSGDHDAY